MRRPGRLSFLLALSPRRRLEDALKTLICCMIGLRVCGMNFHTTYEEFFVIDILYDLKFVIDISYVLKYE
jgi:hypothetical protein